MPPAVSIEEVARDLLGLDQLRPGQAEAITSLLEGKDTLAVMPTGSGKSAIYQLATSLLEGPTVIVSPLIALQRDQVEAIVESEKIGGAAAANSTVGAVERRRIFDDLRNGNLDFLFVAPEQLSNADTLAALVDAKPSLFVVDEAHCISEWGHDFRPDYLRLGAVIKELGRPPVLALTATASPVVRDEIVARLGLEDPDVIVRGFDRPSLWLEVQPIRSEHDKLERLLQRLPDLHFPGIVYVATRKQTAEMAAELEAAGLRAAAYHGGMRKAERHEAQERFMRDDIDVMVATTAFGMGIDKPDVRFVIHYDVPESVDAYYQEAGRAGRDGHPALALLLWRPEDLGLRQFFAGSGQLGLDELERVATIVNAAGRAIPVADLSQAIKMSETRLGLVLARLEDAGALEVNADGTVAPSHAQADPAVAARDAEAAQAARTQMDESRLSMMRNYAESRACRRRFILTYFGEPAEEECFTCDRCVAGAMRGEIILDLDPDAAAHPFPEQSRVRHREWGSGQVLRHEGDSVVVLFDEAGYKTLSLRLVQEFGLLEPD